MSTPASAERDQAERGQRRVAAAHVRVGLDGRAVALVARPASASCVPGSVTTTIRLAASMPLAASNPRIGAEVAGQMNVLLWRGRDQLPRHDHAQGSAG